MYMFISEKRNYSALYKNELYIWNTTYCMKWTTTVASHRQKNYKFFCWKLIDEAYAKSVQTDHAIDDFR